MPRAKRGAASPRERSSTGNASAAAELRPPLVIPPRQTIVSMTVDAVRERILRGIYPEGEPLRQDALAEELGASRIPVREALRRLEAEGLVTFNPHRGAVVSSLSLAEIEEIFEIRARIESDLLRRATPVHIIQNFISVITTRSTRSLKLQESYCPLSFSSVVVGEVVVAKSGHRPFDFRIATKNQPAVSLHVCVGTNLTNQPF